MTLKNKLLFLFQNFLISLNYIFFKNIDEIKLISENLNNNDIIFDVGSNVGSFTHIVSKHNKDTYLSFHTFEPNKDINLKTKNLTNSKKHTIKHSKVAISLKLNKVKFYKNSISSQSSLKNENNLIGKSIETYEVKSISLDRYCEINNISHISLLKIDVEGSELEVLMSGKKLIESGNIKLIKIEIENKNLFQVFSLLNQNEYDLVGITNQVYINNKLKLADYYFINPNTSKY